MRVLQIGCGGLGRLIAEATLAQGHDLTIVRRSPQAVPAGASALYLDVVNEPSLPALSSLETEIVLYCLAPLAGQSYAQTYQQGLRHVLANLNMQALRHVFFMSSTSVYGEQHGEWVDDETLATPLEDNGKTLLAAEQLLDALPCGHTALRASGLYGPQRLYLLRLLQQPERWPQHTHWTNRIHEQDVAAAVVFCYDALSRGARLPAHCILTDGMPAPQHEVLQWLAAQLESPGPHTPSALPHSGKRIRNTFLKQAGFEGQFADYRAGYAAILSGLSS